MADYEYIVSTGTVVPDTSGLRADVESEWISAFGQDLPVTSETPQGVMITMEVEARDGMVRNNAEMANQINPDIAGGIFLDAIGNFTRSQRRGATSSILNGVQLTGIANTIVPAGSIAVVQVTGERFQLVNTVVLSPLGVASGQFAAVDTGPIAVGVGRLTEIASSVLGWEQVYNPSSAVIGSLVESDTAFRRRRRNLLALQSSGTPETITSRLYALDGVRSLSFRENYTNANMVIEGVTLIPKSIYACVEGGEDLAVATALLASKSAGANWNGAILLEIIEPASGQSYSVKFDRPVERTLFARFTIRATTLNAAAIIPDAIAQYANGELQVGMGLRVGDDVSPFELAAAVNEVESSIFVSKVELSTNGTAWTTAVVDVNINQVARIPASAISVIVA